MERKKVKIAVDLTYMDLEDLLAGETFDYTYVSTDGKTDVEVHLFNVDHEKED